MFSFFKKNSPAATAEITFKISGMHCTGCSLNIDGELEDTPGVLKAETSYARGETKITYDPKLVELDHLRTVIEKLEYTVL